MFIDLKRQLPEFNKPVIIKTEIDLDILPGNEGKMVYSYYREKEVPLSNKEAFTIEIWGKFNIKNSVVSFKLYGLRPFYDTDHIYELLSHYKIPEITCDVIIGSKYNSALCSYMTDWKVKDES
jgi:hypothetical protein